MSSASSSGRITLVASLIIAVYWLLALNMDVYRYALLGAIYEILWLPMLAGLILLPVVSLVLLVRQRFKNGSLHYYSIIILTLMIVYVYFIWGE